MEYKNGALVVACVMLLGFTDHAAGQFGFAAFGKSKKNQAPVLDPKGTPANHSVFDFGGRDSVLTFDGPVSVVKRLNDNTHHAFSEARAAITKPFTDLKKDIRLWSAREPNSGNSFQIIPDWMKPAGPAAPQQPATLGDWLSQDRPQ